jgi:uncharacterized protein YybS (DUF2232 family)
MPTEDYQRFLPNTPRQVNDDEINWVDQENSDQIQPNLLDIPKKTPKSTKVSSDTVIVVETAFLASAASLVWLIYVYFPIGPILKIFFPIPIALIYLRRGNRASWMAAIVSGLLLLVLMGPTRSILFLMPYGLMGVLLGACWQRKVSWMFSIVFGTILGSFGMFFRFWLTSILVGENLWIYVISQITQLADWLFFKLGILAQPSFVLIQTLACGLIVVNNLVYLFAVHLIALMLLDRLNNPISQPPEWVRVLLDY